MQYTVDDIRKQFDSGTFARGQAYAREQRVRKLVWTTAGCDGEVLGSGRNIYHQRVRVTRKGPSLEIDGDCSCPMDYNCKHVVVLLLSGIEQRAENISRIVAHASPTRWLDQLALARKASLKEEEDGNMGSIGWVLVPSARGEGPYLYLCKMIFMPDGTVASSRPVSAMQLLWQDRSVTVQPGDELALRLYAGMRAGGGLDAGIQPFGEIGYHLLCCVQANRKLWWGFSS